MPWRTLRGVDQDQRPRPGELIALVAATWGPKSAGLSIPAELPGGAVPAPFRSDPASATRHHSSRQWGQPQTRRFVCWRQVRLTLRSWDCHRQWCFLPAWPSFLSSARGPCAFPASALRSNVRSAVAVRRAVFNERQPSSRISGRWRSAPGFVGSWPAFNAAAVALRESCIHRSWRGPEWQRRSPWPSALALQPSGPSCSCSFAGFNGISLLPLRQAHQS